MTVRRLIIGVGAVLLLAGVIGLLVPVSISNGNGGSISCGNAIAPDSSAAKSANEKSGADIPILGPLLNRNDYVAQCQSSIHSQQMWSIPLAVVGVITVAGAFLVRRPAGAATA
jgi:hypothetical protein